MAAALRLPFAASSGVLVTLAFFAVLWKLVGVPIETAPPLPSWNIEFTRLIFDTPTEVKRQEKTERPPPTVVPEGPRTGPVILEGPGATFVKTRFQPPVVERSKGASLRPDGDVVPIVRIAPDYPPGPLKNGTQGWVQVRFTVTTIGTVRDAVVVNAEPHKVFDAAALKAIARWRYNPKVEDGVAVERVGIETIIRFQLEE